MQLTQEQQDILATTSNLKINAVAGSGKTTTVMQYAKTKPSTARILYIAFNKSVKIEAQKKFNEAGLTNVQVETAHSLAYKHIVFQHQYSIKNQGYKPHEIPALLGLRSNGEKHYEYIIANHVLKFITLFCNSDKNKVEELNYLETIDEPKVQQFVKSCYPFLVMQTRLFLAKMNKGNIEVIHDFYLKKFQLSKPQLPYDYILFDEGQDASLAMLDVFLNQNAIKIIVGDTHQQIYSWRYAINSLQKVDFEDKCLSNSFRFNQSIAGLANGILQWKNLLSDTQTITPITGSGTCASTVTKATIGRTNLGLLINAIDYVTNHKKVKHIYFEGNFNSYTYADDGASLYDVLNLHNGKLSKINDPLIRTMRSIKDLEEYIEKTGDAQLSMLIEIVKEYENDIFDILKTIKEKHVSNEEKHKAEMIFSTVHRCKGMEYDVVHLAKDFIDEAKIEAILNKENNTLSDQKIIEEINLLYVAVTRTKNILHIPQKLLPKRFIAAFNIIVTHKDEQEKDSKTNKKSSKNTKSISKEKPKKYTVVEVHEAYSKTYFPWTSILDDELTTMYCENFSIKEMSEKLNRSKGSIWSRIKKLDLENTYS